MRPLRATVALTLPVLVLLSSLPVRAQADDADAARLQVNKELVRRFIEEVVNTGQVERIGDYVSPDYRETEDPSGRIAGLEGARNHVLGVRQIYPDLELTIERQIAEGDWVVTCITARGTHRGSWLGMPATGKRVEITGVNVDRVVDGRIVEHGGAANMLIPLLEIGAVEIPRSDHAPDSATDEN